MLNLLYQTMQNHRVHSAFTSHLSTRVLATHSSPNTRPSARPSCAATLITRERKRSIIAIIGIIAGKYFAADGIINTSPPQFFPRNYATTTIHTLLSSFFFVIFFLPANSSGSAGGFHEKQGLNLAGLYIRDSRARTYVREENGRKASGKIHLASLGS